MHPREEGYNWFSGDGTKASRIDYLFTRDCPPSDAKITPVFFSDHSMLSCTLSLGPGVTIGRGLWKLNCSLLEDKEITSLYREQFTQWQTLRDSVDSRALWWDLVKGEVIHPDQACAIPGRKITDSLGSKWERLRREVVKRSKAKGGKGLPDLYLFLGSRYTDLYMTLATSPASNSKTGALVRFWLGSYLRPLKLIPVDLRVPVSFQLPTQYNVIKTFLKPFALEREPVSFN
ncbi:hypothetical protein DPEC_G00159520 [Dallia pectoralis]|uniref:Uncharacterized protein n=1 Tax=Dallia pectoralis TaxID=75939 RepID=A0ACC2GG27_DALPE|nr:hypothetical protein DPEC_G00159520 [Dallia pectoralis]